MFRFISLPRFISLSNTHDHKSCILHLEVHETKDNK